MAMALKAGVLMAVCVVLGVLPAPVAADNVRGVFDQMSPGVVVSAQGDVITAAHVVQAMDEITVEFADGATMSAHVVASEPAADLALLRVHTTPGSFKVAPLGDS